MSKLDAAIGHCGMNISDDVREAICRLFGEQMDKIDAASMLGNVVSTWIASDMADDKDTKKDLIELARGLAALSCYALEISDGVVECSQNLLFTLGDGAAYRGFEAN